MTINKKTNRQNKGLLIAGVIIVLAFFVYVGIQTNTTELMPQTSIYSGDVQEVILSVQNYGYVLAPSTLNKDIRVRMVVDMSSVQGCLRDVVIPEFGVRKLVSNSDNIIEFTPTKTGEFDIFCSMKMGIGKFEVV
ncbi:hypothetical protein COV18_00800 [Candidatus Woesearchaeota archaeon CG10_big_fil_rev_8_21_14_0_10_37_12]|nr:MAG: hypothetical protein COV18_00800 [Candidatus Woesearchaeota archaeon CG10_big_fil_rev_8_21_14_0_10_37_12]